MNFAQWEYAGINIEGLSLAGVRTSITLPQHSICFDVAQGFPHAISMNNFFISHGHMDHAGGIPYIISQKAMHSHKNPKFHMPIEMIDPMLEIMKQWSRIEGHTYDYQFVGVRPGDLIEVDQRHFIKVFTTVHRIPCVGYSLYRRFRKLRKDLEGLPSDEVKMVKERGEDPTEERTELILSFTGDTQIEFLDKSPEVKKSKILLMETTYLDDKKPISTAKEWGHTHLDELIPRLDSIESERIVLIHSSARYAPEEAQRLLKARLPKKEHERVMLFTGR